MNGASPAAALQAKKAAEESQAHAPDVSSVIHAWDSGPVLPEDSTTDTSLGRSDSWRQRTNLLCCFSSTGYHYRPHLDVSTGEARPPSSWGSCSNTGELSILPQTPGQPCLLPKQSEEHSGKITLVLDLDGALCQQSSSCGRLSPCSDARCNAFAASSRQILLCMGKRGFALSSSSRCHRSVLSSV